MESCKTCPSFVAEKDVPQVFSRNAGAPMCARYGHVLGRNGLSEKGHENLQEQFALNCDSHGQPRPAQVPVQLRSEVATPDVALIKAFAEDNLQPDDLKTCRHCVNLVPSSEVVRNFGFPLDLCRAKGKLIFNSRSDCKGCPFAKEGNPVNPTTSGMSLRPEYDEGFSIPVDVAIKRLVSAGNTNLEPTTFVTEKEVTEADKADGIRAWRRVKNPDGSGQEVFLPIFDREHFTPEQQTNIPSTDDMEHPELYIDYGNLLYTFGVESFMLDETLCLQGPPGVGKTEFARWIAWLMQVPFRRFSFTSSSEVDDMIGKMMYDNELGTYFQQGRIPQAYAQAGVLVCDELNLAEPPIREALRPAFDNNKQLVLDASAGESVTRHPYCFFVIAQNPSWDMRNLGASEMADADYNRLSIVHLEYPPEAVERHIIMERCKLDGYEIPEKKLDLLMSVANDLREASKQGTIPFTWGIRQQIKVARKTQWYSAVDAYKRAALDFYEEETRTTVIRIVTDYQYQN